MDGYKQNSLKAAFGLEPITPNEQFYRNPCAETISDIPKSFQTEEMVLLALNGETTQKPVLKNVAKRLLTQQICEEAVSRAVTNFIYVPDAYKTERMCLDVIDVPHEKYRDFSPYLLIRYVPEKYLSGPNGKEFFKRAVRANNSALVYVPTEYITGELFEDSTDSMGSAETKEHISVAGAEDVCYSVLGRGDFMPKHNNKLKERFGFIPINPTEDFYEHPCAGTLSNIPKAVQTEEMVLLALEDKEQYGAPALKYVARKLKTAEICDKAVSVNVFNFLYTPEEYRTPERCLAAVSRDRHGFTGERAILSAVPEDVLKGPHGNEICKAAVAAKWESLQYVPKEYITAYMLMSAAEAIPEGDSLYDVSYYFPRAKLTKTLCVAIMKRTGKGFNSLPPRLKKDKDVIDAAISSYPDVVMELADEQLTEERLHRALELDNTLLHRLPDEILDRFGIEHPTNEAQAKDAASSLPEIRTVELELPEVSGTAMTTTTSALPVLYDLTSGDSIPNTGKFFYITDLHLESQLGLTGMTTDEIKGKVAQKVDEMLGGLNIEDMADGVLLIGGDVADSEEVAKIFYDAVLFRFHGPIIFVLGNHELWDGCTYANGKSRQKRSIDEVVTAYKQFNKTKFGFEAKMYCLENEVLVCYKNSMYRNSDKFGVGRKTAGMPRGGLCVLTEEMLLNSDCDDLREFFDECSMIVLGGLGFCGLNPRYNADTALFRDRVSREEDIERSKRFRAVYNRVMSCASDKRVVVLTHTQMEDWTTDAHNKGWVYVNGHTHQNGLVKTEDGVTVLYDNQVGYKPKKWHLNQFSLERYYDPFEAWADGIYRITPQQYMDFNAGRGIQMEYFRQQGDIYALKQKGIYMFMLQHGISLYLLRGGQKLNVFHGLEYYAANLEKYVKKIQAAFRPYRNALDKIAAEVKRFGGSGYVHGSIVDIDYYNHIYLDPFDGYLMPYFAVDVTDRREFRSVQELLESSPIPALGSDGKPLLSAYTKLLDAGGVSILAPTVKEDALAVVPMEVLDEKNIYAPSRVMKSIQYLLDKGVVRVWNDAVLSMPDRGALPNAKPELYESNE